MRPPQSLCLCFSLQALCYLRLEMFKSWPRRAASSFVQYNTGCVVPYFLYAYESVFPVNLPKLFTHQWKILLPMQAGPDVTIRAANRTISALFARSLLRSLGASPLPRFWWTRPSYLKKEAWGGSCTATSSSPIQICIF